MTERNVLAVLTIILLLTTLAVLAQGRTVRAANAAGGKACCLVLIDAIGTAQVGAVGSPSITAQTRAIIVAELEEELGRPLTRDESDALDFGIDQGAGIGYEQGFGACRELALGAVCP